MKTLIWAAPAALLVVSLAAGAPHAAALDGVGPLNRPSSSMVEKVAERRCSRHSRARHCREGTRQRLPSDRNTGRGYGYAYGTPKAEFYPTGSSAWWQAMEREGRTGYRSD
jgi:hypothetical protein